MSIHHDELIVLECDRPWVSLILLSSTLAFQRHILQYNSILCGTYYIIARDLYLDNDDKGQLRS